MRCRGSEAIIRGVKLAQIRRGARKLLFGAALVVAVGWVALRIGRGEVALGNLVLRLQRGSSWPIPTWSKASEARRGHQPVEPSAAGTRPRNVVLLIGDGMGIGEVSSASMLLHGGPGGLSLETAPVTGLMRTWSADDLTTDSAAAATAMATGFKTANHRLSTLDDGGVAMTLLEAARDMGLSTAVVTTGGLVDATPAAFSTHADSRRSYQDILAGILASRVNVVIGGDWKIEEMTEAERAGGSTRLQSVAAAAGYALVRSEEQLLATEGERVLAVFPARDGDSGAAHGPPLAVTARRTLALLEPNPRGFVAVMECEGTDVAGHRNEIAKVLESVSELDAALRVALETARRRGDTLVLVTADHDTGSLGIVGGPYEKGRATVRWSTTDHTAQWVPVFAFGPGAERFGGVLDNTEVAWRLGELLGLTGFPAAVPD